MTKQERILSLIQYMAKNITTVDELESHIYHGHMEIDSNDLKNWTDELQEFVNEKFENKKV